MPIRPTSLGPAALRGVRLGIPVVLAVLLVMSGCGEKSPEELLKDANAELAAATQARDAARATLDQLDKRLAEAQAARDRAAEAFEKADQRWLAAKEAVGQFATDEVLHREVNRALLEAPDLEGTTIQARVQDRVVTLIGEARAQDQVDRAKQIVREIPGVFRVRSDVVLRSKQSAEAPRGEAAAPGDETATGAEEAPPALDQPPTDPGEGSELPSAAPEGEPTTPKLDL